jgi:hypothetical protein
MVELPTSSPLVLTASSTNNPTLYPASRLRFDFERRVSVANGRFGGARMRAGTCSEHTAAEKYPPETDVRYPVNPELVEGPSSPARQIYFLWY